MKKTIFSLFSLCQQILEMIWPEKCPDCGGKLHKQGHKTTSGRANKFCLNPNCEWTPTLKPQ
ncbi:MAG: hypothetical protein NTX00_03975 [Candidatus Parcubacteria bacterium]|nr:hypothetical protein [Candidatus Parcubacteria bacterium]